MSLRILLVVVFSTVTAISQVLPIEPGVSHELAKWRAARYSDVCYKLNLTLEKMSPVLKGTIEIRVKVGTRTPSSTTPAIAGEPAPIILDWRKIKGHEEKSAVSNVTINGKSVVASPQASIADEGVRVPFEESNEHLIFRDGVVAGENVIKLDFTSPILTSGSAITRYVDKEDGSEYIYSLFVPSDASTAFPVFDQPDLKARFSLTVDAPKEWRVVTNVDSIFEGYVDAFQKRDYPGVESKGKIWKFYETKPISTYVFAFAAGDFAYFSDAPPTIIEHKPLPNTPEELERQLKELVKVKAEPRSTIDIYVRKSQAAKFKPHATEVFRLNREAVKYFEQYFDYKFPFQKYDLVLIPEFPFGGMEHAGATFLRESSIIFPQEPTKNDLVSRATLIFHEAAHQWFGDTVTMRWFDDLWLKEGFATFTAYKAMERIMPEMNAWKVFYERIKQGAYQTDSTRGTTAIYQPIANLSAAKSAYGNIVYNKAPAFLRQAEFYLGEDKFQTAVRAFLKKHEFGNAGWEDLVKEFEAASGQKLTNWANGWVKVRGAPVVRSQIEHYTNSRERIRLEQYSSPFTGWQFKTRILSREVDGRSQVSTVESNGAGTLYLEERSTSFSFVFPNYGDYGYGIFLLDEKSREYVLKNIQNEKDPFLRTMMWGSLWDSVREGEMDPREYVELVVKVLGLSRAENHPVAEAATPLLRKEGSRSEEDESTIATLLGRTGTALNYYIDDGRVSSPHVSKGPASTKGSVEPSLTVGLRTRVEDLLIERMRNAPTLGQRITYYRAFLNVASSNKARGILKDILNLKFQISDLKLKTKDKFDIVTRLLILGDPAAATLLAELEKAETNDDAKRYAYAARAGIGTAKNKAKYWKDFTENKAISESWIEAAFGSWNSIRHSELTLPYLQKALQELPNHKRSRKIFFVNGWLGAFIGGQRSEEALNIVNKFLADNPNLDKDLRLKILENVDLIERAVKIRGEFH